MIKLACSPGPAILSGENSAGAEEARRAIAFYGRRGNLGKAFPFRAYKDAEVLRELQRLCYGKCAYCESLYAPVSPADIEHYRPKAGVVIDGKLRKPGYYWLAATWSNLLPSCIDCNRARTQEFRDAEPRLVGKANKFPIANEAARAHASGQEAREERLLLHPCMDDPEQHLEFTEKGEVYPRKDGAGLPSVMGSTSIEVYGLMRKGLVDARSSVQVRVVSLVILAHRLMRALDKYPGEADIEGALRAVLLDLKRYTSPKQPYAAMCRETIKKQVAMLDVKLGPFGS